MKFMIIGMFFLLGIASAKTVEITQKQSGKSLSVQVVSSTKDKVTFLNNGKEYTVPLSSLSAESVKMIRSLDLTDAPESKSAGTPLDDKDTALLSKINEAIGHDLFGSATSLWSEKAEDIAKRLKWKAESKKENNSSYRLYTKPDYSFLGARPYCLTLYGGKEDVPERFSLVFANKGDFGSKLGQGENHFKTMHPDSEPPKNLNSAIEMDEQFIAEALTEVLGESESQYYGEKEDLRKVQRWDAFDQSFLLSAKGGEYVHLLIVRSSDADAKGKVKFVKDADLKDILAKNVRKEENGDVWITNIPMVNQGPKGYCAPATFERALRYMNVPADMYLLATAATTQAGTNTMKLAEDAKRIVRSKARRIKDLTLEDDFKINNIQKFIDKGVPVLWQMRSLTAYNDIANKRTKMREGITDFTKWAEEIQEEADKVKGKLSANDKHHICMVIGYNEATHEIAVSDSWGPRYELRWVHEDICQGVTSRGGFVIDF